MPFNKKKWGMEAFLYGNDVKVLILAAYFAISYMSYTKKLIMFLSYLISEDDRKICPT